MKNVMRSKLRGQSRFGSALAVMFMAAATAFIQPALNAAEEVEIVPVTETAYGETFAEHSAAYWQWLLSADLEGHPGLNSPEFDVRSGQRGKVWFLSGPLETATRNVTVPAGKAVFIGMLCADASSLEEPPFYGGTEEEQRAAANAIADHIVNPTLTINGQPVAHISDFRVTSPQFEFEAPSPWLFGEVGGEGTAVADGYYVLLRPLPKGTTTVHFTGAFVFTVEEDGFDAVLPADVTYNITVK